MGDDGVLMMGCGDDGVCGVMGCGDDGVCGVMGCG